MAKRKFRQKSGISKISTPSNMPETAFAVNYGVDIQALIDNLKRPVAERIRRHQIALDTFQKLRNAKKL
jgi:peroxiredoxin